MKQKGADDVLFQEDKKEFKSLNEPLTQADLDKMDFDKVWISYGPEPDNGEWALVYNGLLYSIDDLEGAGFEDMLNDLMRGDALDNPSGTYRVYRFPLKEFRNTLPDSPLTMEQLREMDKPTPVWLEVETIEGWDGYWCLCNHGNLITPGLMQIPADKIDGDGLRVYAYHPNHIDWEQWVSVDDHLPSEHDSIFKKWLMQANGLTVCLKACLTM